MFSSAAVSLRPPAGERTLPLPFIVCWLPPLIASAASGFLVLTPFIVSVSCLPLTISFALRRRGRAGPSKFTSFTVFSELWSFVEAKVRRLFARVFGVSYISSELFASIVMRSPPRPLLRWTLEGPQIHRMLPEELFCILTL